MGGLNKTGYNEMVIKSVRVLFYMRKHTNYVADGNIPISKFPPLHFSTIIKSLTYLIIPSVSKNPSTSSLIYLRIIRDKSNSNDFVLHFDNRISN